MRTAAPSQVRDVYAWWFALSTRETHVAQGLLEGLTRHEIARALDLSIRTVDAYLGTLYRKTHTTGRDDLLSRWTS